MCLAIHVYVSLAFNLVCVYLVANVNDRSMTGERDSEVTVRYEDKEMVSAYGRNDE